MDKNKNFEAYAKSLLGGEYGEKKSEKGSAPWLEIPDSHPKPFDIIVVDSNDTTLMDEEIDKGKNTGIGKSSKTTKNQLKEDGRLTPVVIDMNDSPFDEDRRGAVFRKRRKGEKKELKKGTIDSKPFFDLNIDADESKGGMSDFHKDLNKKNKFKLEWMGSERDDSGISLNGEGEENEAIQLNIFHENIPDRADSESDSDLAYFCVDHMKMCKSRSDFRKHRKCHLDCTKSGTNSPAVLTSKRNSPSNNEKGSANKLEERSSSLSRGSRAFSRAGRTSAAAFIGMQTMYKETLEKLYNYSGVIIEDRQSLKEELQDKKIIMQEKMLKLMEEIIAHILKLRNKCLAEIELRHTESQLKLTHNFVRIEKFQNEINSAKKTFQVPNELSSLEEYKDIIRNVSKRSMVLQEILRSVYDLCNNKYVYEFKADTQAMGVYDIENIAYVQEIPAIPLLPPFLSVKSTDDADGDQDFTSVKSIERIENVGGKHESGNEQCCFTGCAYILDDSVLLADWSNGVIKMLNKQGLVADTLEFQQSPWDVVQSFAGQAAVTVPQLQTVFFVEAEPHLRVVDQFKTKCHCFGISKIRENYAVTCDPWSKSPSVRVFDKLGNTLLKVQADAMGEKYFKCPLHICSDYFNSVMYISDATADCIYAISLSGEIIFCYEHTDLEYPTGVATDRNNCLFVCGKTSSNIHKLSNSGSLQEMLIRRRHGLSSPCAIAFHPNGDHMIVTDLEADMSSGYCKLKFM